MFNKILVTLCALFCVSALNAFEFSDKAAEAKIEKYLQNAKTAADAVKPHYGYNPIVFELQSVFNRHMYTIVDSLEGEREISLDFKHGDDTFTTKCYATVINKEWLLTHKDCLGIEDVEAEGDENLGDYFRFTLDNMKFIRGDYNVTVDVRKDNIKYDIDSATGAVLLNVKSVCLETTAKSSNNACMRFWDWMVSNDNGTYKIPANYTTIILSNITPKDNVLEAFQKRAFYTPLLNPTEYAITVNAIKDNILSIPAKVSKAGKPLVGEPLFHKKSATENILVGININNDPARMKKSTFRQYKLFGPSFTNLVRSVIGKNSSVILTTDLNVNNKI